MDLGKPQKGIMKMLFRHKLSSKKKKVEKTCIECKMNMSQAGRRRKESLSNVSHMFCEIYVLIGQVFLDIDSYWRCGLVGTGQNLWGTRVGTIDRGRTLFLKNKLGGGDIFWKKYGGEDIFSRKKGGLVLEGKKKVAKCFSGRIRWANTFFKLKNVVKSFFY